MAFGGSAEFRAGMSWMLKKWDKLKLGTSRPPNLPKAIQPVQAEAVAIRHRKLISAFQEKTKHAYSPPSGSGRGLARAAVPQISSSAWIHDTIEGVFVSSPSAIPSSSGSVSTSTSVSTTVSGTLTQFGIVSSSTNFNPSSSSTQVSIQLHNPLIINI